MSKVLVVEPHRMLQQAIALALFPVYEVKIASAIPESSALRDFKAVIVDSKSLGESAGGAEAALRAVQSWIVPTVWLQGASQGPTPKRENLIPINTPIQKEVLLSALAKCLGIPAREKRLDPSTRAPALAGDSRSGFRPTGVPEGATGSPGGLHKAAVSSRADDNQGGAAEEAGDLAKRAPALAGGPRSGFRPMGVVEDSTGLPVGFHSEVIDLLEVIEEGAELETQQAQEKK